LTNVDIKVLFFRKDFSFLWLSD